ncbi:phosphoketolase family protein [Opitutales bacterium ASA1]|nr:phosphoketolase family protein [Opitutales bacterium ASA1]
MHADWEKYLRTVDYLAAAQIHLRDNVLLREPLRAEHVKPRLLGHWGTCPGLNLVHAALNRVVLETSRSVLLVTGPGHGAPASLANLYLEGSLHEFYPHLRHDLEGLRAFVRAFSWPGGFPSHLYPGVPGTIHEGGELGYALATAFGAAFDNPDLLVACIVGDGEAETGPTATAWHCNKFLDARESGAVLPVLHVNGFKISSPTIFGSMSNEELTDLFRGYGWEPRIVDGDDLAHEMHTATRWAVARIDALQHAIRTADSSDMPPPRWPMLVLRSPKGWKGVRAVDGQPVEGSFRSHQVPIPDLAENDAHLALLEDWLRSYRPEELFDERGAPVPEVTACCPRGDLRVGCNPHAFGGRLREPLALPSSREFAIAVRAESRGAPCTSGIEVVARWLAAVIAKNPSTFRIVCPDELTSNKLGGVFEAPTQRCFQWPVPGGGCAEHIGRHGGRVLEMLSEHTCQAWLQGYLLTGRHGLFPSYEAFLPIVTSMMDQYAKFLKMSAEFSWRSPVSSLNYLETSTLWRQEHNGFSHQSPGFINSLLNKKGDIMRVYLPPDANCLLATLEHCLAGVNHVNLVVANKNPMPCWLTMDEAVAHCRAGASVWQWASTYDGVDPDVVLVGIGDVVTTEVLAAASILRADVPGFRIRVVNVTDLLVLEENTSHPHGLDRDLFDALFTARAPVVVAFHGYPSAVKQLLHERDVGSRFRIHGYCEEGNTTTPFDMLVRNGVSRWQLAEQAVRVAAAGNPRVAVVAAERCRRYEYLLRDFRRHIVDTGEDPAEVRDWAWENPRDLPAATGRSPEAGCGRAPMPTDTGLH